ncbi:DUF2127 domain-containing protein [Bdellovibrio sp. HCB2-146]|uniref:DUF2127 domain-containing protein n=1 Tax=Bdellovibrio sp. HCB2-146 TaxID=3394362 RepID=UPI0039BD2C73
MALFEAFKGLLVLAGGLGLLDLMHRNLEKVGRQLLSQIGVNPRDEYPKIFLRFLSEINDGNIRMLAFFAFAYSLLRFTEAYGLWRGENWAKWLGIISGAIYLPLEFYEMAKHFTAVKLAITVVNILVVIYLVRVKISDSQSKLSPS